MLVFPQCEDLPAGFERTAWVELHPKAAAHLGLSKGESVGLVTASGEVRLPLVLNPNLHPKALAVPFWVEDRRFSLPLDLLGDEKGTSGGLVYSGRPVYIVQ